METKKMFILLTFFFLISIISTKRNSEKVYIEIFTESLCPDSTGFY